jgi:hypothetical protein
VQQRARNEFDHRLGIATYLGVRQCSSCTQTVVGLQILTAANVIAVFWVVASCNDGIALKMEAAMSPEASVNLRQTKRSDNPEDSHLQNSSF